MNCWDIEDNSQYNYYDEPEEEEIIEDAGYVYNTMIYAWARRCVTPH